MLVQRIFIKFPRVFYSPCTISHAKPHKTTAADRRSADLSDPFDDSLPDFLNFSLDLLHFFAFSCIIKLIHIFRLVFGSNFPTMEAKPHPTEKRS